MDVRDVKQYIYENNKTEYILEHIGCHHIQFHHNYYTCANYNGDNIKAVQVFIDNDFLRCVNYTRVICETQDKASLIDLVMYNKNLSLFHAIKYLCDILGLDYYQQKDEEDDLPESLKITQMLIEMQKGTYVEEEMKLSPIPEVILSYYKPYMNNMFAKDGIPYDIQQLFEVGYDDQTNTITIPIRDEIGNLVGVKGRKFDATLVENKYLYLEPCAKSKILYGMDKSYSYIKKCGFVYVGESEKSVMQWFGMGIYNAVSVGGKKISKAQIIKLSSLGVKIIIAFDKDVKQKELEKIANEFIYGISVYAILDQNGLLEDKESPTDNQEKFKILSKNLIKLK